MKKFIIVILLLAVCGALVYFGYPEISKLINGEQTVTSSEADTASDISSADNSSEAQTSNVSAEGGNPGNTDNFALEITISEDKYFVNNHEISIDELKTKIDGLETGARTIKINDENSTLKAFNAVKDYLDEKKIAYSVSDR
ncbi:MAG: hypothetical protein V8T26_02190 [[Eubacterium] siraeum]